jgi:hypothetical protein
VLTTGPLVLSLEHAAVTRRMETIADRRSERRSMMIS